MKRIFLILMFCCMGAWNACASDGLEVGGGVGSVDLGAGSTWIAYASAELPLTSGLEDSGFVSSIVGRLGTTGTVDYLLFVPVSQTINFFISGLFKAAYELNDGLSLYGMAGFSFGSASTTVGGFSSSNTDSSISWGIGADYRIDDQLKVGVDYTAYWSDVTAIAANVMFKF